MKVMAVLGAAAALILSGCSNTGEQPSTGAQLDTSEPWDLVWISDSIGGGVADAWADRIEEARGVEVRVHDHVMGGASIEEVRHLFSEDPNIRDEVAGAEIIVVYGNPSITIPEDMGQCLPPVLGSEAPQRHTAADLASYAEVYRDIFDIIFELRSGQPTVIRTFDEFTGMLAGWRIHGMEAECTAGWEAQSEAIRQASAEYGVLHASFYDAFNGVDHDEDAAEKGYITWDDRHASPEGILAQAEVMHALGYDPIVP
jgi:hypothetical protein